MRSSNLSSAVSIILLVIRKNEYLGHQKGMTKNDTILFALLSVSFIISCISVYISLPECILLIQNFMRFPMYFLVSLTSLYIQSEYGLFHFFYSLPQSLLKGKYVKF